MLYWLLDTAHGPLRYISVRTTFAVLTALVFVLWGAAASCLTHRMGRRVGPNVSVSRPIAMIHAAATGNLLPLSAVFIATLVWMNPFNPYVWIVLGTSRRVWVDWLLSRLSKRDRSPLVKARSVLG
jgi:phospho-N-acetylmuramoyl-pentapeptide-transferase